MIVENMENEEDVPEGFFDDFDKTEFLDPLRILDSWSGNAQEENKADKSPKVVEKIKKKKLKKVKGKSSDENDLNLGKKKIHNRELKRSRSPYKSSVPRRRRSGSRKLKSRSIELEIRPRKRRSISIERRSPSRHRRSSSRRKRSLSRQRRSISWRRSRSRMSVSRRRKSKSISELRRSVRSRENFLRKKQSDSRNLPRSRSRDRRIRSRERQISPSIYEPVSKIHDYEKRASREPKNHDNLKFTRRDPLKTKRDILRDKDKCAKNISDKRISQRLKAVETGLIPPGMELDVELDDFNVEPGEIQRQSHSSDNRVVKSMELSLSLSPSPSSSKVRRKEHYQDVSYRHYSYQDKEDSLERKIKRTLNDWGKTNSHLMPRRDRSNSRKSRSPPRKKTSFLDEINKKLSLTAEHDKLRHIQEKINGYNNVDKLLNKYAPISQNVPCLPYSTHYGQPYQTGYSVMPYQHTTTNYNQFPNLDPFQIQPNYVPTVKSEYPEIKEENSKEKLKKMLDDDGVSLTELLTAYKSKLDHSTTVDIKNKIQVITRCQDALKLITDGSRPVGRLFYKKPTITNVPPIKNQSPMKSVPCVRFYFTTKMKIDEKMKSPLTKLLVRLGLKYLPPLQPEVSETSEEQPLMIPSTSRRDFYPENVLMKMTQTDLMSCDECEYRKNKRMCNVGIQCGNGLGNTVDSAVQVDVDDFHTARSALKNMIKTQSLASLTPAQLLAQLGPKPDEKRPIFPIGPNMLYKPPERNYNDFPIKGKDFPSGYSNPVNPSSRNMDNFGPQFNYDQYINPQPRRF